MELPKVDEQSPDLLSEPWLYQPPLSLYHRISMGSIGINGHPTFGRRMPIFDDDEKLIPNGLDNAREYRNSVELLADGTSARGYKDALMPPEDSIYSRLHAESMVTAYPMHYEEPWTPLQFRGSGALRNQAANETNQPPTNSLLAIKSSYAPSNSNSSVYFSAKSTVSKRSFHTEASSKRVSRQYTTGEPTSYKKQLAEKSLWPVDPMIEQNWSGRGQHAEFQKTERKLLDSILQVQELLGSSSSAVVESVRCKRILLARKTIRCIPGRPMTRTKAIEEVAHLTRLHHAHIVRVIGTYVLGQDISILIYPVARYNLQTFLHETTRGSHIFQHNLDQIMGCLSNALAYLHGKLIKHMDVKPQNILVATSRVTPNNGVKVYLADFGIARSYQNYEATETDGPTMYTRKYAAPEVVDQDKRGLAADIFSLGCVFMEIFAAARYAWGEMLWLRVKLQEVLGSNKMGDRSYQANIDGVHRLLLDMLGDLGSQNFFYRQLLLIKQMLDRDPAKRPLASDLQETWPSWECCAKGPDKLEAATRDDDELSWVTEDTG